jgi:predicted metal-binding membrane protein
MRESTPVGMFLGAWVVMVGAGMVPATLPAARLVGMTRGCCAFLMALMVALGLMSIGWIVLLALVVLLQKVARFGLRSPVLLGLVLVGTAVVTWI